MSTAPVDIADYLTSDAVIGRADGVALALPMLHYETFDEACVSWCRDWRAEIRMTDLNAEPSAPRVTVGAVDFVIVQPSEDAPNRPIAEHLSMLGRRAARFGELFVGGRLEPRLDVHDEFCDGMPMYSVLLVLSALVNDVLPPSRLGAWATAEVIETMLPTTSGMVAVADSGSNRRRLVSVDRPKSDWRELGLTEIPGHQGLLGRATLFTHLGDARAALSDVADQVLSIRNN